MFGSFQFYLPTKIIFGAGTLNKIAEYSLPGKKALIVTTQGGSARRNGALDNLTSGLDAAGICYSVFDGIHANPDTESILKGAACARRDDCDFIIGLGGGSAVDAAKAIAVLTKNGGDFWDYIQRGSGGRRYPKYGALPIVAIPTTAGTGTEADPWLVVSNLSSGEKIGCGWDFTYPVLSIVDPALMLTVPPKHTAYQGMDAFFHAAEGFVATCATPVSELFSLQAISLIAEYLPAAVHNPADLNARSMVAWASTAAGIVESLSDTISQHYISHAVTAAHENVPHGAALIALSVPYFEQFTDIIPEKLDKMAAVMNAGHIESPRKKDLSFIQSLQDLIRDVGMAGLNLKSFGVSYGEASSIVRRAYETDGHLFGITPVSISMEQMTVIVKRAIEGGNIL